jgi:hypothetical protein
MVMMMAGIIPDLSTRALWPFYQHRHLGQAEGMDKGVRILPIQDPRYLKGSLTWDLRLYFPSEGRCAANL